MRLISFGNRFFGLLSLISYIERYQKIILVGFGIIFLVFMFKLGFSIRQTISSYQNIKLGKESLQTLAEEVNQLERNVGVRLLTFDRVILDFTKVESGLSVINKVIKRDQYNIAGQNFNSVSFEVMYSAPIELVLWNFYHYIKQNRWVFLEEINFQKGVTNVRCRAITAN